MGIFFPIDTVLGQPVLTYTYGAPASICKWGLRQLIAKFTPSELMQGERLLLKIAVQNFIN